MIKHKGLKTQEASKLYKKYGPNEIQETDKTSPLKILGRQIKGNLVIYLLGFASVLSFWVGKGITGYAILAVILLVIVVGFVQEYRAEKVIQSLKNMLMPTSLVIRDAKQQEIPSTELVPGDILVLRSGEKIPADAIIIEQNDLQVNESILTGESKEIVKESTKKSDNHEDENKLFMGSFIVNGKCIAKVVHTGMNTKFGNIASMVSKAEKELPLQKKVNDIAKFMILVAIGFSVLTGFMMIVNSPASDNLFLDTLILVIALCVSAFPEGFPVVLITALSVGAYRMAKKNAVVNRMSIIETLGETTIICSDKTGTITKGEMTVKKIYQADDIYNVSGVGYTSEGEFIKNKNKINPTGSKSFELLIKNSLLCNDSSIEKTNEANLFKISGTPTEASLLVMASKADMYKDDIKHERLEEIPFSSERKMMSVLCSENAKKVVYTKGALEYILKKCTYILKDDKKYKLTENIKKNILQKNQEFAKLAMRTLAFAYKDAGNVSRANLEKDLVFLGFVGIEDPPRDGVKQAIATCEKAGIRTNMITGDNKQTAISVANSIGIKGKVITGEELDDISEEELASIVLDIGVFARVNPEHKIKIVRALKSKGEIVTMTGDGVNDAPALKEAHIGVAMGKNGTDVSRAASDLTLKDDNFTTIVSAIKEGRTIFQNVKKFVSYQLSCNFSELFVLFVGVILSPILGWQIPLLVAMQILFMNLVTDNMPAITLAVNPPEDDIMLEKPRKKQEVLNYPLIIWFSIAGLLMSFMTLLMFYFVFNVLKQDFSYARTTALLTLILLQIANAYSFSSFRYVVSAKSFRSNIYLIYASIISIFAAIIIIYTPANAVFDTVPIGYVNWIIAIGFSILLIVIFNILKRINAKRKILDLGHFDN